MHLPKLCHIQVGLGTSDKKIVVLILTRQKARTRQHSVGLVEASNYSGILGMQMIGPDVHSGYRVYNQ
jgi:hypothetical protein